MLSDSQRRKPSGKGQRKVAGRARVISRQTELTETKLTSVERQAQRPAF
jgi:hypothetical protein